MYRCYGRILGWTALLLLTTTGSALAGNRPFAFTLTPFAGWQLFEGNQFLKDGVVGGLAIGYNFDENWGVEGVVTYIDTNHTWPGTGGGVDVYSGRFDLLYHIRPQGKLVPYVAFGLGGMQLRDDSGGRDNDGLVDFGGGLKYFLPENVALRLDLRDVLDINLKDVNKHREFYHNLQITGGVTFQVGGEKLALLTIDADGDGIVDAYDRCPATAGGVEVDGSGCPLDLDRDSVADYLDACADTPLHAVVDARGCSVDSDGDGIDDAQDKCPGTARGVPVDGEGCVRPVGGIVADSDGDGVRDGLDNCPDTPRGTLVDPQGCTRLAVAGDGDNDGVVDKLDHCPNTPSFVPVNEVGCPADNDGDGVFDVDDLCLGTSAGVSVDATGCSRSSQIPPPVVAVAVAGEVPGGEASLVMQLPFAPESANMRPEFEHDLAKAAAFITLNPSEKFTIEGHTDSTGPAERNLALSLKRAESVREYLIQKHAIPPEKLVAKGFGEDRPVGDNATQEGRMLNRRVVIAPAGGQ